MLCWILSQKKCCFPRNSFEISFSQTQNCASSRLLRLVYCCSPRPRRSFTLYLHSPHTHKEMSATDNALGWFFCMPAECIEGNTANLLSLTHA